MRRAFGVAALAATVTIAPAHAQDKWPSKPITYVVPFPAVGTTDVLARLIAQRLEPVLGTTIEQFATFPKAEVAKWAQVINSANIQLE